VKEIFPWNLDLLVKWEESSKIPTEPKVIRLSTNLGDFVYNEWSLGNT